MTNRAVSPSGIAAPAASYAHAILTTHAQRWLHTSGVVPVSPDGTTPAGLREQAQVVWANILSMLDETAMTATDIVSVTTYVVDDPASDLSAVMAVRDEVLGGHRAASVLVTVPRLAQPAWQVEIAVIAAV